jgi:hypothetical protein
LQKNRCDANLNHCFDHGVVYKRHTFIAHFSSSLLASISKDISVSLRPRMSDSAADANSSSLPAPPPTPPYVRQQRAAFKRRYDALPDDVKATPASILLAEQEVSRQIEVGQSYGTVTVQAQATNEWGLFLPSFTIVRSGNIVWTINATIPGRDLHLNGASLDEVYAVFRHEFGQWRICPSCESTHKLDTCVDCAQREVLSAPQTCGVCMMERKDLYRLLCGHTSYCRPCLKRVHPRRCPSCREDFSINIGFVERKRRRCDCEDYVTDDDDDAEEYN